MNKSEIELANVNAVIADMPEHERVLCLRMIDSLMMSVGHPVTGNTFMMAIAQVNCQIAVSAIRMGVVDENGAFIPRADRPAQGDFFKGQPPASHGKEYVVQMQPKKVTRLSIFPTDSACDPELNRKATVLLDGVLQGECVVADEEKGYISRYVIIENGRHKLGIDGEPEIETVHGKVEIVIPD